MKFSTLTPIPAFEHVSAPIVSAETAASAISDFSVQLKDISEIFREIKQIFGSANNLKQTATYLPDLRVSDSEESYTAFMKFMVEFKKLSVTG